MKSWFLFIEWHRIRLLSWKWKHFYTDINLLDLYGERNKQVLQLKLFIRRIKIWRFFGSEKYV
jgi:hypothetical protein